MMTISKIAKSEAVRSRGFVTIYIALALVVFIGISSLVVDAGLAFQRRSHMQKTADAASVFGAAFAVRSYNTSKAANLATPNNITDATVLQIQTSVADFVTTNYGYTTGVSNTTVNTNVTQTGLGNGAVVVEILRPQATLFARIFNTGLSGVKSNYSATRISTRARAQYITTGRVAAGVGGSNSGYGLNSKATANLSIMGTLSTTNRGDNRSSYYTANLPTQVGQTGYRANNGVVAANPDYARLPYAAVGGLTARQQDDRISDFAALNTRLGYTGTSNQIPPNDGYYFDLSLPAGNTPFMLQLYDPGNANQNTDPSTADPTATPPRPAKSWNETASGTNSTNSPGAAANGAMRNAVTKTRYQVWCDNGLPSDISQHTRIYSDLFDDKTTSANGQNAGVLSWMDAVSIDPAMFPANSKFYLNATTVDGTGKNGFNVRLKSINPATEKPPVSDAEFAGAGNGTSVNTRGYFPISFGSGGSADLDLGWVPPGATEVQIKRFDVDVGTPSGGFRVNYTSTDLNNVATPKPGTFGSGGNNANDITQATDTFALTNYQGGFWKLSYSAGTADQSVWYMTYTGPAIDSTSSVVLME